MAFDMQKAMGLTPSQIAQANAASGSRDSSSGSSGSPSVNRTYGTRDEGEDSFTDQSTSLARKPDGTYAYVANSLLNGGSSYSNPNENGLVYTKVSDQNSVDWSKVNPNTVLNDWRGRSGSSSGNNSYGSDGQYDILDEIEKAKQARIASRKAALSGVLNKTNTALATEKGTIAPQYQTLKNNESSTSQLRAKRISEIMAQKGYSEGYQGQTEIANNVAYRGNLGNLNTQEQGAYNDIAKRGTDAQTEYESALAQAEADADTTAAEQKLAELAAQRNYAREDEQTNLENQRYTDETTYNRGQDALNRTDKANETMGYVNPTANVVVPNSIRQQLAQYSNDYTAFANSTSDPTLKQYARALANEKIFSSPELLAKYGSQFKTASQKQQDWNNLFNQNEFNYQKQRDGVSDKQWQQTMNLNLRQQSFAEAQQKIDNALAQRRISQEDASQALQWAKYNADQDPNSFDNQLKKQQLDINATSKANTNLNNVIDNIDKLYTYKDTYSGTVQVNPNTASSLRSYIIGLRLSDDQTDQLLLRYGLPINN